MEALTQIYPWVKALHILAVISWMAGLLYLPRLFVYHVESTGQNIGSDEVFQNMERKLLRVIMNPAMVATWVFGIILALTPGVVDWGAIWPWSKAAAVIGMTWFHHWCATERKALTEGQFSKSGRHYRLMNEVPTVLLIVIVISVIVRPF
ncbi:MAG: protoporphyrinogen oxidase HemJ [Boseongicola sp.]